MAIKKRRADWLENRVGSSNNSEIEKSWTTFWKTIVPAKIKVFLWRLSKNSLVTEDVHKHRKMSHHDQCFVCGAQDSWRHSLLECTMARCVWVLVDHDLLEHMIATPEPDARSWLFSLMDVLSHDEFTRMTVTLWAIWYARRKLIHEGINQSPYETHTFVTNFISKPDQIVVIPEPTTRAGSTRNNMQLLGNVVI